MFIIAIPLKGGLVRCALGFPNWRMFLIRSLYNNIFPDCHSPVRQGGGVEEKAASVGGNAGDFGEVLSSLWRSFENFDGVQVYGKGDDVWI